jgi:hypothetical protein
MYFATVSKSKFIADCKSDFAALEFRQHEPSDSLLIETNIPSDDNISLCLRFFESLVIIGFYLD